MGTVNAEKYAATNYSLSKSTLNHRQSLFSPTHRPKQYIPHISSRNDPQFNCVPGSFAFPAVSGLICARKEEWASENTWSTLPLIDQESAQKTPPHTGARTGFFSFHQVFEEDKNTPRIKLVLTFFQGLV
ncbi:hypothetical protein JTE90_017776 [Oedothorax gibbosus]|uniref:Uncharacterized protein n=1 Tax=Oedothorax gibbosus TaxID=931172 RepID=A0AAV6ULB7_9ARAC|nr:hypothetical protein JTE90_017776 [Oedothorax gibbosus]